MAVRSRTAAMRLVGMLVAVVVASGSIHGAEPLPNAHAHNDYWHKRPLFDAVDRGFTSVEADVFTIDGSLLVGHARDELRPDRTLESLYLAPLRTPRAGGRQPCLPERPAILSARRYQERLPQEAYQHLRKLLSATPTY